MGSFDIAILEEPDRFAGYVVDENPNIQDFRDVKNTFIKLFGSDMNKGKDRGQVNESTFIEIFEQPKVRDKIEQNIGKDEADKLYGDVETGRIGIRRTDTLPTEIAVFKTINVTPKTRKPYTRTLPMKWTPRQVMFLQVRKQKKVSPKQIIQEYNQAFKKEQRPRKSISSKLYRI
jgi:hypothetical protein